MANKICESYEDRIRPYFEKVGMEEVSLQRESHISSYAIGLFEGRVAGVVFGRQIQEYQHEAAGLARLSHPGIPQCYKVGQMLIPTEDHPEWKNMKQIGYMVVSHFGATPLQEHIDFSSETGKAKSVRLLLGAVDLIDYIHSRGVVHEDIIPNHILINALGAVHLIDFSLWGKSVWPTSDFCGWTRLPDAAERFYLELSVRVLANSEIDREPRGFGRLIAELLPAQSDDPFVNELREISRYLTNKSERFIEHPKSRDLISDRLKTKLQALL